MTVMFMLEDGKFHGSQQLHIVGLFFLVTYGCAFIEDEKIVSDLYLFPPLPCYVRVDSSIIPFYFFFSEKLKRSNTMVYTKRFL